MANKVLVRFIVEKNGTISHVAVESATMKCPPCNKEAIRVIQAMPTWIPGYKYDRPVRVWVRIPIIFSMDE
jgi:protein TonB